MLRVTMAEVEAQTAPILPSLTSAADPVALAKQLARLAAEVRDFWLASKERGAKIQGLLKTLDEIQQQADHEYDKNLQQAEQNPAENSWHAISMAAFWLHVGLEEMLPTGDQIEDAAEQITKGEGFVEELKRL